MCGDSAPPPPQADPRIGEAAMKQAELGQEYLDFTKQQFAVSTDMQKELNARAKEVSDYFLSMAKEDRARYEKVFKPIEDSFVKQASEWDSPERQAEMAGRARADIESASATQRDASQRQMASMGVRPDAGRYAGVDRALGLGTALASVGAQNQARDTVRNQGMAYKGAAIDVGRGLPAQAGAGMSSSLSAGQVPVANQMAATGIMQPGYGAAMSGQAGMGNTFNNLYKNQLSAWQTQVQADAANSAGMGKFLGTLGGAAIGGLTSPGFSSSALGLMFLSSKKAKTNRKPVADGASLDAVEKMPVESYDYKPGMGDGGHHVGPMAEDFQKTTGHGDGRGIMVQDAIGIAMGAIKDLSSKVDRMAEAIGLGRRTPRPAMA